MAAQKATYQREKDVALEVFIIRERTDKTVDISLTEGGAPYVLACPVVEKPTIGACVLLKASG